MEFQIKPAGIGDAAALGRIHAESWHAAYSGIVPDAALEGITPDKRERYFKRVLTEGLEENILMLINGEAAGFLCLGKCRDEDSEESWGEIWGLYLLPKFWHKGFGTRLLDWGIGELTMRGYKKLTLWVLEENLIGRSFYEKTGFSHDGTVKELNIGRLLREYRYSMDLG